MKTSNNLSLQTWNNCWRLFLRSCFERRFKARHEILESWIITDQHKCTVRIVFESERKLSVLSSWLLRRKFAGDESTIANVDVFTAGLSWIEFSLHICFWFALNHRRNPATHGRSPSWRRTVHAVFPSSRALPSWSPSTTWWLTRTSKSPPTIPRAILRPRIPPSPTTISVAISAVHPPTKRATETPVRPPSSVSNAILGAGSRANSESFFLHRLFTNGLFFGGLDSSSTDMDVPVLVSFARAIIRSLPTGAGL